MIFAALTILTTKKIAGKSSKHFINQQHSLGKVNGYKANKYANILMPIANNLGNLQYVLIAIVGT